MTRSEDSRVEVASFTAEQAGELVMWSDIRLNEDRVILGAVACARISREGALYSYQGTGNLMAYGKGNIVGFENVVQLGFTGVPEAEKRDRIPNPYISTAIGPGLGGIPPRGHSIDNFAGHLDKRPLAGEGSWAVGENRVLSNLKEQLSEIDQLWLYSAIYYNLAMLVAEEDMLADSEMHGETERIKQVAEEHAEGLLRVQALDREMQKNLSPFGNVPADQIAGNFTVSRNRVHEVEITIAKNSSETPVGGYQRHVGWPGGRTWPYMDPMEADPKKAYGGELRAIKGEDVRPANYELERELQELGPRYERAEAIKNRLGILAAKEAKSSTSE